MSNVIKNTSAQKVLSYCYLAGGYVL